MTTRLDEAIEDVRREAGILGVVAGLWMPCRGTYVRAPDAAPMLAGAAPGGTRGSPSG